MTIFTKEQVEKQWVDGLLYQFFVDCLSPRTVGIWEELLGMRKRKWGLAHRQAQVAKRLIRSLPNTVAQLNERAGDMAQIYELLFLNGENQDDQIV